MSFLDKFKTRASFSDKTRIEILEERLDIHLAKINQLEALIIQLQMRIAVPGMKIGP